MLDPTHQPTSQLVLNGTTRPRTHRLLSTFAFLGARFTIFVDGRSATSRGCGRATKNGKSRTKNNFSPISNAPSRNLAARTETMLTCMRFTIRVGTVSRAGYIRPGCRGSVDLSARICFPKPLTWTCRWRCSDACSGRASNSASRHHICISTSSSETVFCGDCKRRWACQRARPSRCVSFLGRWERSSEPPTRS